MVKRLQMKVGVANTGSDDHCRPKQTCGIDVLCNFFVRNWFPVLNKR